MSNNVNATPTINRVIRQAVVKSAFQMSSEEFAAANERTIANLKNGTPPDGAICPAGYLVKWGQAQIMAKLGIRVLNDETEKDVPELFSFGLTKADRKRYATDNNATNRPLSKENWQSLLSYFLERRWAITGETLIFDADDMAASAQHRLVAAFVATLLDPQAEFYFIVVKGIDTSVIDLIDTGKSRDLKDITVRHAQSLLPADSLRDLLDLPYGSGVETARKDIAGDIKQAMSIVWHRANGKDVNASTSDYKKDKGLYFAMLDRFPQHVFTDANGQEVETTELERAAMRIYAYDRQGGKVLSKYFGRGKLLAALILASNSDKTVQVGVEEKTTGIGTKVTTLSFDLPDELNVDLDLVDDFCDNAKDLDGPLVDVYKYLKAKSGKDKLDPQYKFAGLVNTIKYFVNNATEQRIEGTKNEAGQVVVPDRVEMVCPTIPTSGLVPAMPRADANNNRKPLHWPHFGGWDIGYQDKDSIKATAALEQAAKDVAEQTEASDPLAS